MPPAFEVSTFKLIIQHVFAKNFLLDLHNTRFQLLINKLCLWTNIQQKNLTILYHMSALFSCKNNFSGMIESG